MKAIVMYQGGETPEYTADFPEPKINSADQILLSVKAVAIKHLDRSKSIGRHYSSQDDAPQAKVIGVDGVGVLEDGTRVYALGIAGMIAEKAIVEKSKMIRLPEGIDDVTAAALPNAIAGSAMALRFGAAMKAGETVLINGATGFTGRIAIQIAKYYGAKRIIVTGRDEVALQLLQALGADEIISLKQDDAGFIAQIKKVHNDKPIDVILDYLWGHTAELILEALKGKGSFTHKTRFVSIGSLAGDKIQLSSEILRSVDLQLKGSGMGSWSKDEMKQLIGEIIPEMLQLAADKKLIAETVTVKMQEFENLWDAPMQGGKRLVITI